MGGNFSNSFNTEETPISNQVDEVSDRKTEGERESPIVKALRSHFQVFPLSETVKKEQEEISEGYNPKGINYGYF